MQLLVGQGQREHRRVQAAVAQPLQQGVGLVLHQQELEPGEALAQARQTGRQRGGADGREQAEPDGAGFGILAAAGDLRQLVHVGQDLAGALDDLAPDRGQHDLARGALEQRHPEFLLQLPDLRRQRRLADEAGLGRPAEVAVLGQGDEVAEVAQVHAACAAGAEVRIRWSKALSAAVEPAPIATTICLYGTVVASPAANTPGTEVWPRSSMTISPRSLSSTEPFSHSVLGSRPIWTKMPASSTVWLSPVPRSL